MVKWRELGFEFDDFYVAVAVDKKEEEEKEEGGVPTISFRDKAPNKIEINKKTLIKFKIDGNKRISQNNIDVELISYDTDISFTTKKWTKRDYGWGLDTNVTAKKAGTFRFQFKVNGKWSNTLSLEFYDKENNTSKIDKLTMEQILSISIQIKKNNVEKHIQGINEAIDDNNINTCLRISNFLAQILHESGGLRLTKEGGVSENSYGGFIGRGLIQITGKDNYTKYQDFSGEDVTSSLINKQKLENDPHAAKSAGWFWNISNLNSLADNNDFIMITRIVNGGFNGFDDRLKYLYGAFKSICKTSTEILDFKNSKAYNDKRASFAWGLWRDPGLDTKHLSTCSNDKDKSIEGYERFLKLVDINYTESNWYNIVNIPQFATIKKSKTLNNGKIQYYILVREAAELRLNKLKNE